VFLVFVLGAVAARAADPTTSLLEAPYVKDFVTLSLGTGNDGKTIVKYTLDDFTNGSPKAVDGVVLRSSGEIAIHLQDLNPLTQAWLVKDKATPDLSFAAIKAFLEDLKGLQTACAARLAGGDTAAIERHVGDLWREAHRLRARIPDHHPLTARALRSLLGRPDLKRGELARMIHGNPSEVSRNFHRDIGLTLIAYRTRLRLIHFIELVERGHRRFLTAAIDAGFGSYSQCHRAFQQAFDCTPRVFFGTGLSQEMKGRFAPL